MVPTITFVYNYQQLLINFIGAFSHGISAKIQTFSTRNETLYKICNDLNIM